MAGNLTRDEARERARLLTVESYGVELDITAGNGEGAASTGTERVAGQFCAGRPVSGTRFGGRVAAAGRSSRVRAARCAAKSPAVSY